MFGEVEVKVLAKALEGATSHSPSSSRRSPAIFRSALPTDFLCPGVDAIERFSTFSIVTRAVIGTSFPGQRAAFRRQIQLARPERQNGPNARTK